MSITPQMLILLGMTAASLFMAVSILRGKYRGPGVHTVALLMLAAGLWMFAFAMEMGSKTITAKLAWDALQYVAILLIPSLWLAYNLQVSGRGQWITRKTVSLLAIPWTLSFILILTNDNHGWMWKSVALDPLGSHLELDKQFGPLYWPMFGFLFGQVILGALIPFQMLLRSWEMYRLQAGAVLSGVVVAILLTLLGTLKIGSFTRMDLGPLAAGLVTWIWGWAILRLRLVDLRRVARNAIVETMNHGVIVLDGEAHVAYMNPVAKALIGWDQGPVLGLALHEIWDEWPRVQGPSGEQREMSQEIVLGQGERMRAYEAHISPLLDWRRHMAGQVLLLRDVTERKRAERELRRYAQELERSNEELERFAYVASHDLQEPLRMVAGYTQLLSRRYRGQLDPTADEFIDYAVDGATRMKELINDLLEYSRVGTRGKPFEWTDIGEVLERVRVNLRFAIEESDATISVEPMPKVIADPTQMVQIFQNLVANAIKFRDDRPLEIHIGVERRDGYWTFRVCDNGIGISEKHQQRIFRIFQRLHSRERYEGTGIGLALCKRIAERHGGQIWVESQSGQGSTFFFTLPERAESAKDDES
jgi:PAS domain S-box-containing protein